MSKCARAYFKVAWKNDTQKVQQQEQIQHAGAY